jgi:thioredoxin reductase
MSTSEVLIVGAGPYGVSVSTHLTGLGVDHTIVGRPMDAWRTHMPAGMFLKSEPYGTDMSCPQAGYDLDGYCRDQGVTNIGRAIPLPVEQFLDYADWYVEKLVPGIKDLTVTEVKPEGGGFRVAFADADSITARQVVVATGILPHFHIPPELSGLPSDLVSHTADHHLFDRFKGRKVAVVGSGQSALETAALLHEAGAETQLVVRSPDAPVWHPRPLPLTTLHQLRLPIVKLCEGWKCVLWSSPAAFRRMPENVRITKARTVLGPRGAWWLKDRVLGKVEVLNGHRVRGAEASGSGVRLLLDGPKQSSIDVDHVIAGTGFRIDTSKFDFLTAGVRDRITTLNNYPVLSRGGESSVPGLYFVGAPAAVSLGPSQRFIAGTHKATGHLARSVAQRAKAHPARSVPSGSSDHDAAFQGTA